MRTLRPSDLAREHGLSAQAVRNYEQAGFIPPAERTPSGYRVYTEVHAAALRAFLALVPAYGHAAAGEIMTALHRDDPDRMLLIIDRGHIQMQRDRETLDAVRNTIGHLTASELGAEPGSPAERPVRTAVAEPAPTAAALTIGELAHRLRLTAATLRAWEDAGILGPARDPATGYRRYRATDIRDAELAHLLRRGGYPLDHIAAVVQQIKTAGGTDALAAALGDWQRRLTRRGLAMLDASAELGRYRSMRGDT
ncbi:TioE family transcriptional regulator [Nocardia sp. NPDC127526]|uniref:TioE family transcriptional regulator n=1 Tax=Nocardia sp. NPDC127526 TaxID=3345393 RepID=UPI003634B213